MAIRLDKALHPQMHASIQRYCSEELDLEIGELQASFLLDFIVREIGPHIYNQAISDAQAHIIQQAEALPERYLAVIGFCPVIWRAKLNIHLFYFFSPS